jgi:hypothetical protein
VRRAALALLAFGAVWVAGLLAVDDVRALLGLLPFFVLLLPLAAGRYPLERTLERLRPRRPRRVRRAPRVVPVPAGRPLLRPGRLLVACDGVRGPPR